MPFRLLVLVMLAFAPGLLAQGSVQLIRRLEVGHSYYKSFYIDTGTAETDASFRVNLDTTDPGGLTVRLMDRDEYVRLTAGSEVTAVSTTAGPLNLALSLPARSGRHPVFLIVKTTSNPATAPADVTMDVSVTAGSLLIGYGQFLERSFKGMRFALYNLVEFDIEFDAALVNVPLRFYASGALGEPLVFAADFRTESLDRFVVTDAYGFAIIDANPASVDGVVRQSVDMAEYYGWITVMRPQGRPAARYQGEFVFGKSWVGPDKPAPVWGDCACCSISASATGTSRGGVLAGLAMLCCLFRLRRCGAAADV